MKEALSNIVYNALIEAREKGELKIEEEPLIVLEIPKDQTKGDISATCAMTIASLEKRNPRDIAQIIVKHIKDETGIIEKTDIAGPGFINFFLKDEYYHKLLKQIDKEGKNYCRVEIGKGEKVQVEFVSANPTGPLHVGHGRGAAVGDALSNLLAATGYDVSREFYINDAGRQVYTLGESVRLRVDELHGEKIDFPDDYYKGEYIKEIAKDYIKKVEEKDVLLGTYQEFACDAMLKDIKKDLKDFGIEFDIWFSENKELHDKGLVRGAIPELKKKGYIFEKDGAKWFKTTELGDDKDRVLIKADGESTYFASDVAYHKNKMDRGFSKIINVWGADHHGYEGRVRAALKAFGYDEHSLKIIFIQLVKLLRGGVQVAMGKREGEFVTLRQVMDEVGTDAARFFFLMRRHDSHLDFDLELAKKQSSENPVYYVQYAHARLCSVERQAEERGIKIPDADSVDFGLLKLPEEKNIMKQLALYPITIEGAARALEPHRITFYLQNLAGLLHNYYFHHRIITDDKPLTDARLVLMKGVRQVIKNALGILGITAPEKM